MLMVNDLQRKKKLLFLSNTIRKYTLKCYFRDKSNYKVQSMLKKFLAIIIIPLLINCSCQRKSVQEDKSAIVDTVKIVQPTQVEPEVAAKETLKSAPFIKKDTPPVSNQPVSKSKAAVKENLTLVGAVVESAELLNDINYKLVVKLQTAIPEANYESIIEPGQVITVYPSYQLDENKKTDMKNPINQKLFELRTLKKKGYFIGKITLSNEMKWYITQVEVYQNAPEGVNNEF